MASGRTNPNRSDSRPRAIIAVVALYAVMLQAFLGALMPMPGSPEGLCAGHVRTEGTPDRAFPHGHGDCCTAAQAIGTALPPRTAPVPVVWPAQAASVLAWTAPHAPAARAPPSRHASPRGPPDA